MSNHELSNSPYRMIRIKQLIQLTSLSRSTIYELMNPASRYYDPSFPKNVSLSRHTSTWVLEEVESWMEQRIEKGRTAINKGSATALAT